MIFIEAAQIRWATRRRHQSIRGAEGFLVAPSHLRLVAFEDRVQDIEALLEQEIGPRQHRGSVALVVHQVYARHAG